MTENILRDGADQEEPNTPNNKIEKDIRCLLRKLFFRIFNIFFIIIFYILISAAVAYVIQEFVRKVPLYFILCLVGTVAGWIWWKYPESLVKEFSDLDRLTKLNILDAYRKTISQLYYGVGIIVAVIFAWYQFSYNSTNTNYNYLNDRLKEATTGLGSQNSRERYSSLYTMQEIINSVGKERSENKSTDTEATIYQFLLKDVVSIDKRVLSLRNRAIDEIKQFAFPPIVENETYAYLVDRNERSLAFKILINRTEIKDEAALNLSNRHIGNIDGSYLNINHVLFKNADLVGANFQNSHFQRDSHIPRRDPLATALNNIGLLNDEIKNGHYQTVEFSVDNQINGWERRLCLLDANDAETTNFIGANLSNSNFFGSSLSGISFFKAILNEAKFDETTLLFNIQFCSATISGVDFSPLKPSNIIRTYYKIDESKFYEKAMFYEACGDGKTKFPSVTSKPENSCKKE